MQQPQSSSTTTLNNYISSGDHNSLSHNVHYHEQNSSCVTCQNINQLKFKHKQRKSSPLSSSLSSDSSSHDNGQLVQPLHRHIVQHSRQMQNSIANLQIQIQRLKRANDTKDIMIQQLRKQLTHIQLNRTSEGCLLGDRNGNMKKYQNRNNKNSKNSNKNDGEQRSVDQIQFLRRQKQIQRIRKQIYKSAQNMMKNKNMEILNNDDSSYVDLKQKLKNIEIKFEDKCGKVKGKNIRGQKNSDEKNGRVARDKKNNTEEEEYQVSDDNYQLDDQRQSANQKRGKHNKKILQYTKKIRLGTIQNQQYESSQNSQNEQKHNYNSQNQRRKSIDNLKTKNSNGFQNYKIQKNSKKQNINVGQNIQNRKTNRLNKNNQNQEDFDTKYQNQLQYQKQSIQRLQQHIQFCQNQMLWMSNFILSFLKMGQKLTIIFNQNKIIKSHWSLKKKTKIIWRYFKHIFSYLID